jgi:hypothetical protein
LSNDVVRCGFLAERKLSLSLISQWWIVLIVTERSSILPSLDYPLLLFMMVIVYFLQLYILFVVTMCHRERMSRPKHGKRFVESKTHSQTNFHNLYDFTLRIAPQ